MITVTQLQARAGISKGYASELLGGRKPSPKMAIKVFRATGLKLGVLEGLSDDEIAVVERAHG